MTFKQIHISDRQSLVDTSMQEYGSYDGVWLFLADNADRINDINDVLPAGAVLNVRTPVPYIDSTNQAVAAYYASKKLNVLSGAIKPTIPTTNGQIVQVHFPPHPPLPRVITGAYVRPGYLPSGYITKNKSSLLAAISANIKTQHG